jgi:hypothetical protein
MSDNRLPDYLTQGGYYKDYQIAAAVREAERQREEQERAKQPQYGAIVYSPSTRRYAYSFNCSNAGEAEAHARTHCGAPDAVVVAHGVNYYLALAVADDGAYGAGWDADPTGAAQRALASCSGPNCHLTVVVDTRSGPVPMDGARPPRPARTKWFQPDDYRVAFRWGVPAGGVAAVAVGVAALLANASGPSVTPGMRLVSEALVYLGGLLCLLCGVFAARATGRARTGALAAWRVGALWALAVLVAIFYYNGGIQQLQRAPSGSDVVSTVVTALIFLIIGAFVGMGLGALGGLVGRNWRR